MDACQSFKARVVGILFLGLVVVGTAPASADITWNQTVMLLFHIPLGDGQFFTTNYVITASGGTATVNIKCFSNTLQRIGPAAGVNVSLPAAGQVAQQTPILLGVVGDLFFGGGVGWCWANNTLSGNLYDTQFTVGITTDLSPGGILNSGTPTFFVGTGLTQMGIGGDIPFFTTAGAQNFAFLLNPTSTSVALTLQLFNTSGIQQGSNLNRVLNPREVAVLPIPGVFGLPTPPMSGSVRITAGFGFLGWFLSQRANGLIFSTLGLDINGAILLPAGFAP